MKTAYVSEGVSPTLADKYSTQQAVLAMRHNASSDKVKLVMEAGNFETVSDAVAKFVGSSNETTSHNSVMFYNDSRSYGKYNKKRNFSGYKSKL